MSRGELSALYDEKLFDILTSAGVEEITTREADALIREAGFSPGINLSSRIRQFFAENRRGHFDLKRIKSGSSPNQALLGIDDLTLHTSSVVKSNVSKHRLIRHGGKQGSSDQGKMRTG